MIIEKSGKKWAIIGEGEGWIFKRTFPTKWKAEIALEVFQDGGRVTDYWNKAREHRRRVPWRAIEKVKRNFQEIKRLNPTCEEIVEYGMALDPYSGAVTYTDDTDYFLRYHNTWGRKSRGRVHIDIGCEETHLMLDKNYSQDFIKFIESKRKT